MSIKQMITAYAILGVTMVALVFIRVHGLDASTAIQCQQNAWPAASHQVHMDWCAANNYPTN